jgi:hypothetical protein
MAKSKSTPGLLAAIQGYTGEHEGSKEHEPIVSQLKKIVSDIHRGSEPAGESSPGKQAANEAARKSFQDEMGTEAGHSGGGGQKTSNEPGKASPPDPLADIAGPDGRDDHLTGAAAVKSGGELGSNLSSSGMAPGTTDIRRIAAERELSRKDTHMKPDGKGGDDNKRSNPPGGAEPPAKRIGEAPAPAAVATGKEPEGDRAARESSKQPEQPPVRVPQQRDPFAVAGEQAKKKLAAALR